MGLICSSQKQESSKNQKKQANTQHGDLTIQQTNKCQENAREITITNGISYFLRRLDQFHKENQPQQTQQIVSFFEKQQNKLESKLECDIAFIIDLTTKNDHKRIRLLKELLEEKERRQARFGIIYLGHEKSQFDLIDDSHEKTYNLQKQLSNLKLDDWISIFQALRAQIVFHAEQQIPNVYILSEHQDEDNSDSILEIVDNLLEDTCQKHMLNFHCNSYKVEGKEFSEQEFSFIEDEGINHNH